MINSAALKQQLPWSALESSRVEIDQDKACRKIAEMLDGIRVTRDGRVCSSRNSKDMQTEAAEIRKEMLRLAGRMKASGINPQSLSLSRGDKPVMFAEALQVMSGQLGRTSITPDPAPNRSHQQWRTFTARATFLEMANLWCGDDEDGDYFNWRDISDSDQARFIAAVLRYYAKSAGLDLAEWISKDALLKWWTKCRDAYFIKDPHNYRIKGIPGHL